MNRKILYLSIVILFICSFVYAGVEEVYIAEVMDNGDKAIIVRKNGGTYIVEKGIRCPSLWRYMGKTVLIDSPGLFLGFGSRLMIPGVNEDCEIGGSEFIGQRDSSTTNKDEIPHSKKASSYYIEASYNDEIFIINGKKFKAETYCFNMRQGDSVIFLEGSPLGVCVSAVIYNLRTKNKCRCWCE